MNLLTVGRVATRFLLFVVLVFTTGYALIVFQYPVALLPMLKDGAIAVLVLMSAAVGLISIHSRPSRAVVTVVAIAVMFSGWALISVATGVQTGAQLVDALLDLRFYGLYPLIVIVPSVALRNRATIQRYQRFLVELGVVAALIGLMFYVFPALDITNQIAQIRSGIAGRAVVGSLGTRPNMGMFCVLIFAATFSARGYLFGRATMAAQIVLTVATLLTFSRTAYVGLATCFVGSQLPLLGRPKHLRAVLLAAAVLAVVAANPSFLTPVGRAVTDVDLSLSGRSTLWDRVGSEVSIVGVGLGHYGGANTFLMQDNSQGSGRQGAVDNEFLKIGVEMGVGLLIFLALIAVTMRDYYLVLPQEQLAAGPFLQVTAMTVMSLGVDWMHTAPIAPMFFIAIGMAPVFVGLSRSTRGPRVRNSTDPILPVPFIA